MMVSPSRAHASVSAVVPNVNGKYDVLALPMLRYMLVFVDWIVPSILKYSLEVTGPRTGLVLAVGRACR